MPSRLGLISIFLFSAGIWTPASGQDRAAADRPAVSMSAVSAEIRKQVSKSVGSLKSFYERRKYAPVWNARTLPGLISFMEGLDRHGLSPRLFHLDNWKGQWRKGSTDPAALAKIDIGTTHLASYAIQSLAYGFVDPAEVHPKWKLIARKLTPFRLLENALDETPEQFARWLENAAAPKDPRYRDLVASLAKYREIAQLGGWRSLPATQRPMGPGDPYPDIPLLRARLRAEGDLTHSSRKFRGKVIDAETANALRSFQFRHGIDPDAVMGPQTLTELNQPASRRVNAIIINLDRLRWVPNIYEQSDRIEVNIGEGALRLFTRGRSSQTMRVIVGQKGLHQTPVFHGVIRYLIFRPYWNVPTSIARGEVVPTALDDPGYMNRESYEIVPFFGVGQEKVLPVTESNLRKAASGELNIRQATGPGNALGLVKFIFPNDSSVYLHDTPHRELFRATDRDFSHGCVRVSKPDILADFVLRDNREWLLPGIRAAMEDESQPNRKVDLASQIAVYLVYWTSTIMDDGRVRFDQDIYGHDALMRQKFGMEAPAVARPL